LFFNMGLAKNFLFFCLTFGRFCGKSPATVRAHASQFSVREVNQTMRCTLCNEYIEEVDFQFGDALEVDGEYWHAECYAEYFDEALESV